MKKEFFVDKLRVVITDTRDEMGAAAASDAAEYMRAQIAKLGGISAIFAAAPSQNEVLEHVSREDIDWSKVTAYHMDEYVGLAPDAPQRFARYLDEHIFSKVNFGKVNYLAGDDGKLNPVYSDMFTHNRADICFMGIGENGHIAFNEPGSSLSSRTRIKTLTSETVKANSRFFDGDINQVPRTALTVGIGTIMDAEEVMILAAGANKARAIHHAIEGSINHMWPVSILQMHQHALIVCDEDAANELKADTVRYFKDIESAKIIK